jgi:hypothetical protein
VRRSTKSASVDIVQVKAKYFVVIFASGAKAMFAKFRVSVRVLLLQMKNLIVGFAAAAVFSGTLSIVAMPPTTATASTMTYDVAFSATNFTSVYGGLPVPTATVTGSFTITFDPTQNYTDEVANITLHSLNITLGSALSFTYDKNSNGGFLTVGGLETGAFTVFAGGLGGSPPPSDDFFLNIRNVLTTPELRVLGYSQSAIEDQNFFRTDLVSGAMELSGVPLPTALPLFASGLGVIGLLGWRRKRKAQTAA